MIANLSFRCELVLRSSISKEKILAVLFAAFMLVVLFAVPQAQAAQNLPLYSWGNSLNGRLGRVDNAQYPANLPARVMNEQNLANSNWAAAASASGGSWAINANGELFAWGNAWSAAAMGQDGVQPPAAFLSGTNIVRPMRVGTADNWVQVASIGTFATLLNSDGEIYYLGTGPVGIFPATNIPVRVQGGPSNFVQISGGIGQIYAINEDGELWVAGSNASAQFGNGVTGGISTTLVKVENTDDNWVQIEGRQNSAAAINSNGELFTWGSNANARTGRGTIAGSTLVPTQIGLGNTWLEVRATVNSQAAINSNGELFAWGSNEDGRTGLGTVTGNTLVPTRVGLEDDWTSLAGSHQSMLAFNESYELWGWGLNSSGQIGDGTNISRDEPVFVVQAYGFNAASRGGGTHSMMLISITPAEGERFFEKRLQKPEGTPIPDVTFTFDFVRHSFNGNTAQVDLLPQIPARTITISPSNTSTTTSGITTTVNSTDALAGISFPHAGLFTYRVTEVLQPAEDIGAGSNSTVTFSQAEYEMRVRVVQQTPGVSGIYVIEQVNTYRIRDAQGQTVDPAYKVPNLAFYNTYYYLIDRTDPALFISKTTTGAYANLATPFEFNGTLTIPSLTTTATPPFAGPVTAVITDSAGNVLPGRTVTVGGTLPNLTFSAQIRDGERIAFPTLPAGTVFNVTETQDQMHSAVAVITLGGAVMSPNPSAARGVNLSVGPHIVHGTLPNSAAFTNTNYYSPFTGLTIQNAIPILVALAVVLPLAYFATRRREAIEKLPVLN